MKLRNKNILLISPEAWKHIFISKHHYATHLAKRGNTVFFLNPPSKQNSIEKSDFDNLYSVQYKGFVKGLRFLPAFLQRFLIKRKFRQLQSLCEVKFDLVWSFDNSAFYDFSALPESIICISHIMDLNQDFEFKKAAKTADICFGVCSPIVNKLLRYNKNSHFINHGYSTVVSKQTSKINKLPGGNKIKVLYAGNLDIIYIDWGLLDSLVDKYTNVDFVFAGPWRNTERRNRYLIKKNFHFLGVLRAEELNHYYQLADILIICYLYEEYPEQLSNTHKMMEYLGSGKMIVATWTGEYHRLVDENLITMVKNKDEYLTQFIQTIKSLDNWNSNDKSDRRKSFAMSNTYDKQIDRIESIILQYS